MPTWFRTYYEDEDLRLYFEADDEGSAARHIEVRGKDLRPVTAASSAEVLHLRDHADLAVIPHAVCQATVRRAPRVPGGMGR